MYYYCVNNSCPRRQNTEGSKTCAECETPLLIQNRYYLRQPLKPLHPTAPVEVFVCDDLKNNHQKVIKILRNAALTDAFEGEAQALIWLNHPGIPQVEASDSFETSLYPGMGQLRCLVMEKIEGRTLEQWLSQPQHKLSTALTLDWLDQLTEILSAIHIYRLLHSDIKPANIMLQPQGKLTLIDFGNVQRLSAGDVEVNLSSPGYTPGYAPSEQVQGQPRFPQSDFFALGRTFAYLLTGQSPQSLATATQTEPLSWRQHSPQLHPDLADLLDWLMAPLPENRPSNTAVVIRAIANLKQSLQAPKTRPRRQYWWGLLTGAVTASTIGLLTWTGLQTRPQIQSACDAPITEVGSLAFSPKGQWLAIASPDRTLRLFQSRHSTQHQDCQVLPSAVYASQFSPDGKYLATASDEGVYQTPVSNNGTLEQSQKLLYDGPIVSLAFSPNGQYLATGSSTGTLNLWQVSTGQLVRSFQENSYILKLSFSRTGQHLAVVTLQGQATVWDWQQRKKRLSQSQVAISTFSPTEDHHLALARQDGTTQLWDIENPTPERTDPEPHQASILDLRFSPDGRYIVTRSTNGEAKVWNWAQDSQRHAFKSLTNVVAVALNSAQKQQQSPRLIAAYGDGKIKNWQLLGGDVLPLSPANSEGSAIAEMAFNPVDAAHLIMVYADGTYQQMTTQK